MRRLSTLAAIIVACMGLTLGLTATPSLAQGAPVAASARDTMSVSATAAPSVAAGPANADYRLGAGDKIRVITFGEDSLTGEFFVGGSGKVSLPLVGEVQAAGLSVGEFQSEVQEALKQGYLKEPRVSVEVLTYRPFYILGEVTKPGEYPYTNGLTVLNAVATANGFTYRANTKRVFVRHAGTTQEQEEALTSTTQVAPGDTIRIAERFF